MITVTISTRTALVLLVVAVLAIPASAGATHIFTDVADGNVHAEGIEWLANAGVTSGCGDGSTYCPNDPVTRAQMATFMYRLSGNDPATDRRSVNAGQLDGLESTDFLGVGAKAADSDLLDGRNGNDFIRVAHAASVDGALVGTDGDILSVSIEAPMDGFLIIGASSDVFNTSTNVFPRCRVEVDGTDVVSSERVLRVDAPNFANTEEDCSTDAVVPVMQGTHTVDFEGSSLGAATTFDEAVLYALYVPFDGNGATPTDFTILGGMEDTTQGNS